MGDIPQYHAKLKDEGAAFFERYVAMFTLRNLRAVAPLVDCLKTDRSSTVLRHEISFILGQMEDEEAVDGLITSLESNEDHAMVRHESAIALGSIGSEKAKLVLQKFSRDPIPMVAESCLVALDTIAYWEAWEAEE